MDTFTTFWMGTATTPWFCYAPAAGTNISSAITESVAKYDRRLIDSSLPWAFVMTADGYTNGLSDWFSKALGAAFIDDKSSVDCRHT